MSLAIGAMLLAAALPPQEGEVDRIMLRFAQRRGQVVTQDQYARLLADTRAELERYARERPAAKDAPRAAYHAAETCLWGGDLKGGLERLRKLLLDHPGFEQAAQARFAIGEAGVRLEDQAGARAAFEDFLRSHPKDERALQARLYVAHTFQNERKYDEARTALLETRALFRDRKESWGVLLQLALLYHAQEKNEDARRTLEEVIRECPERLEVEVARRHLAEYLDMGGPAPAFREKDALGTELSLEAQRGKAVVLYFFDPSLQGAEQEALLLRRVAEASAGKPFQVLGVCVGLQRREFEIYRDTLKSGWPLLFDGKGFDGRIARLYNARGLPSVHLLDRQGRRRFYNIAGADLRHAVEKLLEEK